jgi:hypothetical protein
MRCFVSFGEHEAGPGFAPIANRRGPTEKSLTPSPRSAGEKVGMMGLAQRGPSPPLVASRGEMAECLGLRWPTAQRRWDSALGCARNAYLDEDPAEIGQHACRSDRDSCSRTLQLTFLAGRLAWGADATMYRPELSCPTRLSGATLRRHRSGRLHSFLRRAPVE